MLLKWIVCGVPASSAAAFSSAQLAWERTGAVQGFLGQVGGWEESKREAGVLALWSGDDAYGRFMATEHDRITVANRQGGTYDRISVDQLDLEMQFPGTEADFPAALAAAPAGAVLRVADCQVRPARAGHFLQVQREVWAPGMNSTGAMLALAMGRSCDVDDRFLVFSIWQARAAHETYVRDHLLGLRQASCVAEDVEALVGRLVALEPSWTVVPARGEDPLR